MNRKNYESPELEIEKFTLSRIACALSDPGLEGDQNQGEDYGDEFDF